MSTTTVVPDVERQVIDLFTRPGSSYASVAEAVGRSRGFVYDIVLANGLRRNENRKRERAQMQGEFLRECLNRTVTGDAIDFIRGIPSASVDLIATSPPYNVGKAYGDSVDDAMLHQEYRGFMITMIAQMARILKPNAVAFVQLGTTKNDAGHYIPLDTLFFEEFQKAGLVPQNRIVWPAHHGLTAYGRLSPRHETVLVFSKGPSPTFNPTVARTIQKNPGKKAFRGANKGAFTCHPLGASPTDVWNDEFVRHLGHNHPEKADHPAQFPVALPKRAIMLYTMPGDLVCDVFNGTGSTQIACVETGRDFIGADLNFGEIRNKRVAAAKPDRVSILPGVSIDNMTMWNAAATRTTNTATPHSASAEAQLVMDHVFFGNNPATATGTKG